MFDPNRNSDEFKEPELRTEKSKYPPWLYLEDPAKVDPVVRPLIKKWAMDRLKRKANVKPDGSSTFVHKWLTGMTFLLFAFGIASLVIGLVLDGAGCNTLAVPTDTWLVVSGALELAAFAFVSWLLMERYLLLAMMVVGLEKVVWTTVGWVSFGSDIMKEPCHTRTVNNGLFAFTTVVLTLHTVAFCSLFVCAQYVSLDKEQQLKER